MGIGPTSSPVTDFAPSSKAGGSTRPGRGGGSFAGRPSTAGPSRPAPSTPAPPLLRPHGPTTREWLTIRWDHPVYVETAPPPGTGTWQRAPARALAREQALEYIAGDDPRPLLVVRECRGCNRTDRALLVPGQENEKTILLSRWFHCVKLPMDVSEPLHPFHELFPRDDAEHLFVSGRDGSNRIALEASTSRRELWEAMTRTLVDSYAKDPTPAFEKIAQSIEGFDALDERLIALETKRGRQMESPRFDPSELREVEKQIAGVRDEIARELLDLQELYQIDLKCEAAEEPRAAGQIGG